jgi:hypothetical protein
MRKQTQCERVLKYLEQHESISQFEAMTRLRIGRLAARIHDMETAGIRFKHDMVRVKDEDGNIFRYMRYRRA